MARSYFKSEISLRGPFFENDPEATFLDNLSTMLHKGAEAGVKDVVGRMGDDADPISAIGGYVREHVIGLVPEVTRMWVGIANHGYTADEAISLMAAASEKEDQTGAFRKAAARFRAARMINGAELLKGIQ
jgi:hypothetical protein